MSKKSKIPLGYTRQRVRDLSYLKGKSVGRVLSLPAQDSMQCSHLGTVREIDSTSGTSQCSRCHTLLDFSGNPLF